MCGWIAELQIQAERASPADAEALKTGILYFNLVLF